MKNNKGFAISSVVYAMLILFLGLILLILGNLARRKAAFDKEKNEILSRFNEDIEMLCTLVKGYPYEIGSKYECELGDNDKKTFYALETTDNRISLIMNMNIDNNGKGTTTGSAVAWSSDGSNHREEDASKQAITAKEYLKTSTANWIKLNSNQISLPTAYQIATASGKTFNGGSFSGIKTWLYENLSDGSGLSYAYWTSTPYSSGSGYAFNVSYGGYLSSYHVSNYVDVRGVRPVITILKSQINIPILCTAKSSTGNGNLAYGRYNYGDEYLCDVGDNDNKTFYVLEDNGDNLSLIMNINIDSNGKGTTDTKVTWSNDGSNHKDEDVSKQAVTAKAYLQTSTTSWTKLNSSQISLPDAYKILESINQTYEGNDISGLPTWLYGNLDSSKSLLGYWTSTPVPLYSNIAAVVKYNGVLTGETVYSSYYGVRPVITIQKTQVKNLTPIICTAKTSTTNGNLATGEYNYGDEYSCDVGDGETKTFYVLEDGDTTNLIDGRIAQTGEVSLIMNKNIDSEGKGTTAGNAVAWASNGSNANGPVTALEYLTSNTINWKKVRSNQISLPTASQLAQAAGKTFNGSSGVTLSLTWLSENLNSSTSAGAPIGYWTSNAFASDSTMAWRVSYSSTLSTLKVNNTYYGVRPIITISKERIKN